MKNDIKPDPELGARINEEFEKRRGGMREPALADILGNEVSNFLTPVETARATQSKQRTIHAHIPRKTFASGRFSRFRAAAIAVAGIAAVLSAIILIVKVDPGPAIGESLAQNAVYSPSPAESLESVESITASIPEEKVEAYQAAQVFVADSWEHSGFNARDL